MREIFKKYSSQLAIIAIIILASLISHLFPHFYNRQKNERIQSLDTLVPKGFVLIPIDILNGKDILNLMGSFGVVDLYDYSRNMQIPNEQVAQSIKVVPPHMEDGFFTALIPEKEVDKLFEHSPPFYAVIQNPEKQGSQIHKKSIKKSLTIIEEDFK